MRLLSLDLKPATGSVSYNGETADRARKAAYATYRAVLSQSVDISFPLSVEEVVMMGRYPHFKVAPSQKDKTICQEVMHKLGIERFSQRNFLTLSGGEKQRVQFARVLTQIWEPPPVGCRILLLDEPITALDLRHQFDFLKQLDHLIDDRTIVISVLHDLNLVLNHADEVLLLSNGSLFASGKPSVVLSPEHVQQVFHVSTALHHLPGADLLWVK
jgi:iron complex transport system ATP-binding protein